MSASGSGGTRPEDPGDRALTAFRDALLLGLSLAAGVVDAVVFLRLAQVFVANMTGNTVLLGLAVGQVHPQAAARSAVALAAFCFGVAVAATITLLSPERPHPAQPWPPVTNLLLGMEAVLLAFATLLWQLTGGAGEALVLLLIALTAIVMGVQSGAARSMGVGGVATTYVTGALTNAVSGLLGHAFSARRAPASPTARRLGTLSLSVWAAYGAGAVLAGAGSLAVGSGVLWVSVAVLTGITAAALVWRARASPTER